VRLQRLVTWGILALAAGLAGYLLMPVLAPSTPSSPTTPLRSAQADTVTGLAVGDRAPDFTLIDVHGRRVTLAALRGHAVWLNFWATWCPWCRTEMPDMEQVHRRYGNKILIYGVDVQESAPTVSRYLSQHGITYDVLLDRTGAVATLYDVNALPESVFIAPDGRIAAVHTGALLSVAAMLPYVRDASGANH
jgi:cytochrome c biogenesis protein CcmG/thiol:disulfide interchange protein DsbE